MKELDYSRALVPKHNTLYKIIIAILIVIIIVLLCVYFGVIKPNIYTTEETIESSGNQIVLSDLNYEDFSSERQIGKTQMKIDYIDNCSFSISYPEIGIEEIDEKIVLHARDLKNNFLSEYRSSENEAEALYTEHIDYKSLLESEDTMKLVFIDSITLNDQELISKNEYSYVFDLNTGEEISSNFRENVGSDSSDFVSLEADIISNFDFVFSGDIVKFAFASVNVRADRDLSSNLLGTLNEGDPIEVISGDNDWEAVVYNGEVAYVKAGYLSRRKLLHKDVELEIVDRNIDPEKPMVAITYDDGPNPKSTPRILDTLEQYGAVATFFDLGQLVNSYPDIVKREEQIGCEVGNHSYSHKNFILLSDEEIQDEISKSEAAFIKALGHKTTLFRLPYGNVNLKVKENLEYPIIKWNVDSLDWKSRNKSKILTQIRKTKNFDGYIILLHSIYGTTADATEVLVPELLDNGYQLVTVSELAYYKGYKTLSTATEYNNFIKK